MSDWAATALQLTPDALEKENCVASEPEHRVANDVEVRHLVHYYADNRVLDDVSLSVRRGEFFSILGPSGSGKTTTLRIIGGFVIPTAGTVTIKDADVTDQPPYLRNTTMVFQQLALFPHMTVFGNLAYGLKIRRRPRSEIEARVSKALRLVKLEGLEKRYPRQLSGGQQQRVALARSIILEPSVVLFDEPLGSLDLKLRREMQVELKNLQKAVGTTFIYVTHDQEEALTMSDRVAVMNEGRIEQIGTAEQVYERPKTRFVADFIGDTNLIDGIVVGKDGPLVTVKSNGLTLVARAETQVSKDETMSVSIRPERISLTAQEVGGDQSFRATVSDIIYVGPKRRMIVHLQGGQRLEVDSPAQATAHLNIGDGVWVSWSNADAHGVR